MLAEWLTSLVTPCDPAVRRLGYLRELIAIRARARRCGAAWVSHQAAIRSLADQHLPGGELAVVVGGALGFDVPLDLLQTRYRRVVALDVVFLGPVPGVEQRCWDATGAIATWAADPRADPHRALVDPGWPPDLPPPDLVWSANLLTQLHLLPEAHLRRWHPDVSLADACARQHLTWLARRPGVRVLVADAVEEVVGPDGTVVHQHQTSAARLLAGPRATWAWDLAPRGEWDRDHALRRQVGWWDQNSLDSFL